MSGSLNKVMLIGNLGRDPEVRHTNDGARVGTLSLATSESWKDKATGERKDRTEWHRIVIFNENLVDVAEKYMKKGTKVFIEGQLQTRKWTDASGSEKYTTEVVLSRFKGELTILDSRSSSGDSPFPSEASYGSYGPSSAGSLGGESHSGSSIPSRAPIDDEIPF